MRAKVLSSPNQRRWKEEAWLRRLWRYPFLLPQEKERQYLSDCNNRSLVKDIFLWKCPWLHKPLSLFKINFLPIPSFFKRKSCIYFFLRLWHLVARYRLWGAIVSLYSFPSRRQPSVRTFKRLGRRIDVVRESLERFQKFGSVERERERERSCAPGSVTKKATLWRRKAHLPTCLFLSFRHASFSLPVGF